jgi:transcription-repair coupling factor (superfamily II helicase)
MIQQLIDTLFETEPGRRILAALTDGKAPRTVRLAGISGSLDALAVSGLHARVGCQMLVVTAGHEEAERLRDDLALCLFPADVELFGSRDHQGMGTASGKEREVRALRALVEGTPVVVVAEAKGLVEPLPEPEQVSLKIFLLERGKEYPLGSLTARLAELGFQQKDFVEASGDYAVRGGILDIFPFSAENPVRLEFFGDTIESVREFEPLSQRSIRELKAATIVPDILGSSEQRLASKTASLTSYLRTDALIVLEEPDAIRGVIEDARNRQPGTFIEEAHFEDLFSPFNQLRIGSIQASSGAIEFGARPQPSFNSSMQVLRQTLSRLQEQSYTIMLMCDGHGESSRLKDLLATASGEFGRGEHVEQEIPKSPLDIPALQFSTVALHQGFLVPWLRLAVFTEHQIFNRLKRRGKRRASKFRGLSEREFQQLRRGDYVVHADYGIGQYDGLKRILVQNAEQEVVALVYDGNDRLYVNLNYINKLQKYSSKEGHIPKLTRLGSVEWEHLKSRAKKKVKDIARDLIRLYAQRKALQGFAFQRDTPWQKELEASFLYEDTFDQAKATREVKEDMEAPWPMDRLICGDVGYGKTEVAVRAAFKSVLDGKQVAVLVPTTILAAQHYNTFVDRTSKYGLRIEVLSRFKSKKEQMAILSQLASGGIDIIIGTHRLLSKDVVFKDLGLLVIDEEHRFGVSAKEKLRHMRATVDTLTLTATPIPRTLHFSLLGARDLSIIATAPRNRRPVITEIAEWNDELIRDAVLREVQRGGQVFVVHDRIQKLDAVTERLRVLLPGIRVRAAHGQMHTHELEEVMLEFLEKRVDVLVSTKIIESGLDMPNVNTIFIDRADRFGMAELYQLRGRVGRSNTQAYAFMLTPPLSAIPQSALRRLQAVEEFSELGSGFNLAMRDMEIRGTGNLLGSEQSGFIENMGFETYTKILEEAVRELKEEDFKEVFQKELTAHPPAGDTIVEPEFDAFIPEEYVKNDHERLAIYRRLYNLSTNEQLQEVQEELRDRFGVLPEELENLFWVVRVRLFASKHRLKKVHLSANSVEIDFPPETDTVFYEGEKFQELMRRISSIRGGGTRLHHEEKKLTLVMQQQKIDRASDAARNALEILEDLLTIKES